MCLKFQGYNQPTQLGCSVQHLQLVDAPLPNLDQTSLQTTFFYFPCFHRSEHCVSSSGFLEPTSSPYGSTLLRFSPTLRLTHLLNLNTRHLGKSTK